MIKLLISKIYIFIELYFFKVIWKKNNVHNFTTVGNVFPLEKVKVGKMTYGVLNVNTYGNDLESLKIGSYCSIAGNVLFLLGGEHSYKKISSYPFNKFVLRRRENTITKGPIIVKDDVWIGENSLILSGVEIGQGAVIGAGSIVSKNVPPYAIFVGNSIKKYRFSSKVIEKLIKVDFTNINNAILKKSIKFLYEEINELNVDEIINEINELLKDNLNEH